MTLVTAAHALDLPIELAVDFTALAAAQENSAGVILP
jgi:hypothetical protein